MLFMLYKKNVGMRLPLALLMLVLFLLSGSLFSQEKQIFKDNIKKYQQIIDQLVEERGMSHPALIEPLLALGQNSLMAENPLLAINPLKQAIQISRLQFGLNHPSQLPILEHLSEAYVRAELWEEAYDRQKYRYFLALKQHEGELPGLLAAMNHLATWSTRIKKMTNARDLYFKMIGLIKKNYGKRDLRLISPLRGVANTYLKEREQHINLTGHPIYYPQLLQIQKQTIWASNTSDENSLIQWLEGERILKQIIQLQLSNPETGTLQLAESYIHLGDWYMLFYDPLKGMKNYRQAISILEHIKHNQRVSQLFGQPKLLYFPNLTLPSKLEIKDHNRPSQLGFIELTYRVNEQGQIVDMQVNTAMPDNPFTRELNKIPRLGVYRPAFKEGQVLVANNITYRHEYYYQN